MHDYSYDIVQRWA